MSIRRLLVANRGEIAVRIIRTCQRLGIETVLVTSAADRESMAAGLADRSVVLGPAPAFRSYLVPELVVHAAVNTGCDALHPGYGFLSERASLAQLCRDEGILFVGPDPQTIDSLGDKVQARTLAAAAGTPSVPGSGVLATVREAQEATRHTGFPALIKAAAGGGGRGMSVLNSVEEIAPVFNRLSKEAKDAFGDGSLYLERFIPKARHVEVQVVGDGHGTVVPLGLRDCSVQRRYQKVVEESGAISVPEDARQAIIDGAVALLSGLRYRGAGTVEFLHDVQAGESFFIEVNTRIQVEHPVTEETTGLDIVELQLRAAVDDPMPQVSDIAHSGHAIEFRINAEDPNADFRPSPGRITHWRVPAAPGVRVDTHCAEGTMISPYYDSMLAKLIVTGKDRPDAVARACVALDSSEVGGLATNLPLLRFIAAHPDFRDDTIHTRWLETAVADLPQTA